MQITIKGKQLDTGDALREYVNDALSRAVEKYFPKAVDAVVTFTQDAHLYKVDISVNASRGIHLQSSAEQTEIYPAFDSALDKIDRRLRRYKTRIKDDHGRGEATIAQAFVLESVSDEENSAETEQGEPAIIAEMQTHLETLSVAEAVMRLELSQAPALMFSNRSHKGLNMIYRRPDGNIGWVDPQGAEEQVAV